MVFDDELPRATKSLSTTGIKMDDAPMLSPKMRTKTRNPLDSLSSFVNSLEIKSVGTKISNSASCIRRSVSHRFSDLPLFPAQETSDDEENESTLNDDEWLASPSLKQKMTSPRSIQAFVGEMESPHQFTSNEHLPSTCIKTFTVAQDNLPRIDEHEMQKILKGEYSSQFDEFVIIDCRFPYEYEGGHISQAINVSLQQSLEEKFLDGKSIQSSCRKLLIFHCEYSLLRGPTLATHLRKVDRHMNAHRYPYLHYPDIVILERGYKGFFDKFKHFCEPQAYVAMKDNNHKRTCDIEMSKVIQASKLTRAKSFNQFPPRLNLSHSRSSSLTTLLNNSEANSPANTATLPRRRRSLKIKKRERKDARPQFTQSLLNFLTTADSPQLESPVFARFDHDDFMPPTALFRNYSKSSAGLFLSVNSSLLLLCSESLSPTFSSSESLLEAASPFNERPDFYKSMSAIDTIDVTPLTSMSNYSISHETLSKMNQLGASDSIGSLTSQKAPRPSLARLSLRPSVKLDLSSPNFSSPLSINTSSAFASRHGDSIMEDSSIDSSVDFFLHQKNVHNPRTTRINDYYSQSSDLADVGE